MSGVRGNECFLHISYTWAVIRCNNHQVYSAPDFKVSCLLKKFPLHFILKVQSFLAREASAVRIRDFPSTCCWDDPRCHSADSPQRISTHSWTTASDGCQHLQLQSKMAESDGISGTSESPESQLITSLWLMKYYYNSSSYSICCCGNLMVDLGLNVLLCFDL